MVELTAGDDRLAPRADAQARHATAFSPFHREAALCAPCHGVTGPVNTLIDGQGQDTGVGLPEQRTYEEWEASDFGRGGATCQDCHMPRAEGYIGVSGAGPTFHFLHADTVLQDTRIPPRGFDPPDFQLLPIGRDYQAGDGTFRHAEVCDGADNDCDGTVDDGFGLGAACGAGVGACRRDGGVQCDGAGGAACNAVPGPPSAETRDGLDNDCDGLVDEGFPDPGDIVEAVLRQGRAGYLGSEDATISAIAWTQVPETTGNFGGSQILQLFETGTRMSLLRFDLGGIPAGAQIVDAEPTLFTEQISYADRPALALERVTQSWIEGTCAGQYLCAANGATRFGRGPGLGNWSSPGGAVAEIVVQAALVAGDAPACAPAAPCRGPTTCTSRRRKARTPRDGRRCASGTSRPDPLAALERAVNLLADAPVSHPANANA